VLERIFHYDGKSGEQSQPNNHWQNRGSPNRRVQPVIVGDSVEVGDDIWPGWSTQRGKASTPNQASAPSLEASHL
jgi:hypothetical protein